MQEINQITEQVLKSAFKVHTELGPGLLESSYKECLFYELTQSGVYVEKEKPLPLIYQEVKLEIAKVLAYLKLSRCKVGLLLNFHTKHLTEGIKRLIL